MRFTKMHGCGNDFVMVDGWTERLPANLADLARRTSDRHFGVGSDGFVVVGPADDPAADARMRMWNIDGSEAEMCGNAIRCAARLAHECGRLIKPEIVFQTKAGRIAVSVTLDGAGRFLRATADMGRPRLTPPEIPVRHPGPGPNLYLSLDLGPHGRFEGQAVGMGNPHVAIVVEAVERIPLEVLGPLIEHHPDFPKRTNVHFLSCRTAEDGSAYLVQRTWERGCGVTLACGTGACASVVAAMLSGRVPTGNCRVQLPGGDLSIAWSGQGSVFMTGGAEPVFTGVWA